jgi:peptidoglycan/LPS O-acetylase OafA/YrhL
MESLTGIRGVLAILVVICHGVDRVGWLHHGNPLSSIFLAFGHFGVVGFFILSGFILRVVYQDRDWTLREFATNRFARIYPLYIVCLIFTLPVDWLSPGFPVAGRTEALGLSVILQQAWFPFSNGRFNGPGWTLSTEFFFYAAFPAIFIAMEKSRKIFILGFTLLFIVTALVWDVDVFHQSHRIPHMRIWEFVLGMVAADIFSLYRSRLFPRWNSALALISLCMGVSLGALAHGSAWPFLEWLIMAFFALSMIGLLALADENGGGWRPMATAKWILCGEISYAIYLLHDGIQRYGRVILENLTSSPIESVSAGAKVSFIGASLVMTYVGALILWRYWEIPARNWLRRVLH